MTRLLAAPAPQHWVSVTNYWIKSDIRYEVGESSKAKEEDLPPYLLEHLL
jgi:hypothetical protein